MKQLFQHTGFLSKNWNHRYGALPLWVLFVVFLVGIFLIKVRFVGVERNVPTVLDAPVQPVTLLFVGDIMMDRGVRAVITKHFEGSYDTLFENTPFIAKADVAFANLEGTVTEEFSPRTGSKFSFRMAPESLDALKRAGFDIVSFSNNHVGDYSTKGFVKTLELLQEKGIAYAGAGFDRTEAITPTLFTIRSMRIGYLAFTDVGPDWLQAGDGKAGTVIVKDPQFLEIITQAKTHADVLVVSFHWGNEYSPATTRQETIARNAIDAGADIIVGHHPHVMQRVEWYNSKLIFYSLGNFIFDQYFSPHTMRGMVAQVTVDPYTRELSYDAWVSPLNKQYLPQAPIPFDESMLVTKTFTP